MVCPKLRIVRIPCGPKGYIPKEKLWPHLDEFADSALSFLRTLGVAPHLLHAHYADAAAVAVRMSSVLGVPMVLTTHSLGRQKRAHLLQQGASEEQLEACYSMSRRIEAEETAFDHTALVFASTSQELTMQCGMYDAFRPAAARVIFPGVNVASPASRETPSSDGDISKADLVQQVSRFLREPKKPAILLLARPVLQKNAIALIRAFGGSPTLREKANLVLVLGQRHHVWSAQGDWGARGCDPEQQEVMLGILAEIDNFDLYGSVAYPKRHVREDVSRLYQWAAQGGGVFVNCALGEPFGLTLLEAAAHGLPVVATKEGGPADIVSVLQNGILVDPQTPRDIERGITEILLDRTKWTICSQHAKANIHKFTWAAHTETYLSQVSSLVREAPLEALVRPSTDSAYSAMVATDLDHTLIGASGRLPQLLEALRRIPQLALVVATGRDMATASALLSEHGVAWDALITNGGTEIWHRPPHQQIGKRSGEDEPWEDNRFASVVGYGWDPGAVVAALAGVSGLRAQPEANQSGRKVCYYMEDARAPPTEEIQRILRCAGARGRVACTRRRFLDVVPMRGSKGTAVRYLADLYGLERQAVLTAGDSGEDEGMLGGGLRSVVVGNHAEELSHLRGAHNIFFAEGSDAAGVLQGLEHYRFKCDVDTAEAPIENHTVIEKHTSGPAVARETPAYPARRSSC